MTGPEPEEPELEEDPVPRYDRQGRRISPEMCELLLHDRDYVVVDEKWLTPTIRVSTSWLAINFDIGRGKILSELFGVPETPPLIFETIILDHQRGPTAPPEILFMRRYATEDEARAGHRETVEDALLEGLDGAPVWTRGYRRVRAALRSALRRPDLGS